MFCWVTTCTRHPKTDLNYLVNVFLCLRCRPRWLSYFFSFVREFWYFSFASWVVFLCFNYNYLLIIDTYKKVIGLRWLKKKICIKILQESIKLTSYVVYQYHQLFITFRGKIWITYCLQVKIGWIIIFTIRGLCPVAPGVSLCKHLN